MRTAVYFFCCTNLNKTAAFSAHSVYKLVTLSAKRKAAAVFIVLGFHILGNDGNIFINILEIFVLVDFGQKALFTEFHIIQEQWKQPSKAASLF